MEKCLFRIDKTQANIRLDQFLVKKLLQYSRAYIKKQIRQGNILVNGKIKKPSYILKENEKINVKIIPSEPILLKPEPTIKLNIIYEDKDVIVLNKPAGLTVHPTATQKNGTLINGLLAYYPLLKDVGDNPLRPGLVHRLDKDTSGLMIITKNNVAFNWLKKQFQERKVTKKYLALVIGKLKEKRGIITKSISRAKDFRKRTTLPSSQQKEAKTYYKLIKEFKDYTLIEVEPKTGRTHQIRVHFASIGHPIAGDKLYGFKSQKRLGCERQFLHAAYLKLSLPNGKILELKSELPKDLKQCLRNLKVSTKNN